MLPYLKRCVSSVRDQGLSGVQHIVMDGGSTDGTVEWLSTQPGVTTMSERDGGMYDALNKGFERSNGQIFAFLNCDEQYLPGTLKFVSDYFDAHPGVDALFGNALLMRPDGTHVAYRKTIPPRWPYILASHLYLLSCAMFFRSRVFADGHRFDTRYRILRTCPLWSIFSGAVIVAHT